MKPSRFTYHRPESLDDALALLTEHEDAKVLAGGQSLVPLLALRLAQPGHIVDIGRLDGLRYIRHDNGEIVVGATTRHADAETSDLVASGAPLLARALPLIGHRVIRNRGTVCGSLAHADPAGELPAVALALDATLVVRSVRGERSIPAADFFQGFLTTALEPDEIVAEVRLPSAPATARSAVLEISRRSGDFALLGVAAVIDIAPDGTIAASALSFFGADTVPRRVADAEAALVGRVPEPAAFADASAIVSDHLDPPDDIHASSAYRKHVAGVLTRRALAQATGSEAAAA